jgi:hypothetical protein
MGFMLILDEIWSIFTEPKKFFQKAKKEKGLKKAFLFSVLLSPISLLAELALMPESYTRAAASVVQLPFPFLAAISFFAAWAVSIAATFAIAAIYHIFAALLNGKGGYSQSYKVTAYSNVPSFLFGWLPAVAREPAASILISAAFLAWSILLATFGFREMHGLTTRKAAIIAVMPAAISFMVAFAVAFFSGLAA